MRTLVAMTVVACVVGLWSSEAAWAQVPTNPVKPKGAAPGGRAPTGKTMTGKWQEYWGVPGKSDVNYHDIYDVTLDGDDVEVKAEDHKYPISKVSLADGVLRFSLTTSFRVDYALRLSPGGKFMVGIATTPEDEYPIIWERTR